MSEHAKITNCCYCGHRCITNMKTLQSKSLICEACGAPVNDFKFVSTPKQDRLIQPITTRPSEAPQPLPSLKTHDLKKRKKSEKTCKYATLKKQEEKLKKLAAKAKKSKKKKWKSVWEKLEDKVDDVFDIFD